MAKNDTVTTTRRVTFEITTAVPLPAGEQVFITGSESPLGHWDPCAFPLTREKDNVWHRTVELPVGVEIDYKITRGSWDTEEITPDDRTPLNKTLPAGEADAVAQHWIHHWKDRRMGPPPKITGNYDILDYVKSSYLEKNRRVIVWLPPSYYVSRATRYPVIYMHDGQQVFDPTTSTWDKAWDVDDWCTALIEEGCIQESIVVAAYSTEDRASEYNPDEQGKAYANFIIKELMPRINRDYRTLKGPENTCIAGASLGGLISFYMGWKHPDVFSKVACLSPSFCFNESRTAFDMVSKSRKRPALKIYMYCGGADELEAKLLEETREMVALLRKKKFTDGQNFMYVEDVEAEHREAAWNKHTGEWLEFLMGA
jgi:predicted alpha/beta superfamily hydrolase